MEALPASQVKARGKRGEGYFGPENPRKGWGHKDKALPELA